MFKSRLQEYAQKVSLPTPVYETIKEGPSHEPTFRSTVIVNDVRYDSLLGFFNRKAAEQSAAEVALFELSKNGEVSDGISPPVVSFFHYHANIIHFNIWKHILVVIIYLDRRFSE